MNSDNNIRRRTIVKGAAWSVPVIAAAAVVPSVAASQNCNQPAVTRGAGSWLVNGPKGNGAGYVGWRLDAPSPNKRFFFSGGSTLNFTWVFTTASGPTGIIPAGSTIQVGIGGENTLDSFWIAQFAPPASSNPNVVYSGATGPFGNWYVYTATADIPAGTVLSWAGTITFKNTIPALPGDPGAFGAFARVNVHADPTPCPPILASRVTAAEWVPSQSATTPPNCLYAIVNEHDLSVPGYYQP